MSTSAKKPTAFVFGSNGATLISALHFQRLGFEVTIFDGASSFNKSAPRFHSAELNFWPATEQADEVLNFLEEVLHARIDRRQIEVAALTTTAERISEFSGFGDKKYTSIPALSSLNTRAQYDLCLSNEEIFKTALAQFEGEVKAYSQITGIRFGADSIESVQVNGGKDVQADWYVFTHTPAELLDLLPDEVLSSRLRSKMARTPTWGRLALRTQGALSSEALEKWNESTIFLTPHAADFEPCVGRVMPDSTLWLSYLNTEFSEDAEKLAGQVRHMRKIIAKAIPELEVPLKSAAISFDKESFAEYDADTIIANLQKSNRNLLIASPLWSAWPGLAGCVAALEMATRNQPTLATQGKNGPSSTTSEPARPTTLEL